MIRGSLLCRILSTLAAIGTVTALLAVQRQYRLVRVDGRSMEPTFQDRDLLIIDRRAYLAHDVARHEVVVAQHEGELWVKRVVGLPGDIVEVREGSVIVNGYPAESQSYASGTMELRPGLVTANHVALLGDNRSMLPGEHRHAVVPRSNLVGRVTWHLPLR